MSEDFDLDEPEEELDEDSDAIAEQVVQPVVKQVVKPVVKPIPLQKTVVMKPRVVVQEVQEEVQEEVAEEVQEVQQAVVEQSGHREIINIYKKMSKENQIVDIFFIDPFIYISYGTCTLKVTITDFRELHNGIDEIRIGKLQGKK
jgi:hypothetical protein